MKKLMITLTLAAATLVSPFVTAAEGEAIYRKVCFACHDTGAAGAPKLGDTALWSPRIEKGIDALVDSVKSGLNAMPPMGTCATCSDEELRAAVEFIIANAQGGGTAAEAPAPAEKGTGEAPPQESQAAAQPDTTPATEAPATAGDAAAGAEKAAVCIACHGPQGNSVNPVWPKLAGQHEDYIYKQLQAFKAGQRENELMTPMALPLSDQDMRDLAVYFASQQTSDSQGKPDALADGESVYRGGNLENGVVACAGCHGPTGLGNPKAGFPRLSNQHAAYVAKALRDYRSGTRSNDLNAMMQGVAAELTDTEIDAVAEYVTNLQ